MLRVFNGEAGDGVVRVVAASAVLLWLKVKTNMECQLLHWLGQLRYASRRGMYRLWRTPVAGPAI